MTIAQTNTLWEIKVHKIHIKEWASVKDEILGMVPWDNKKKHNHKLLGLTIIYKEETMLNTMK